MKKTTNKTKNTANLAARGSIIMTEAKRIRKEHPTKEWKKCVAEAAHKLKK